MSTESESQENRAESIRRQKVGEDAPEEANPESLVGPTEVARVKSLPTVGGSVARRGEDMMKKDGQAAERRHGLPMNRRPTPDRCLHVTGPHWHRSPGRPRKGRPAARRK